MVLRGGKIKDGWNNIVLRVMKFLGIKMLDFIYLNTIKFPEISFSITSKFNFHKFHYLKSLMLMK